MTETVESKLRRVAVVPLLKADHPDTAVRTVQALSAGGLDVVEVVLRTPAALECLAAIRRELPGVLVGAGTVLNAGQVPAVVDAGASFIVSPGLDEGLVEAGIAAGLPVYPGTATATEVQRAFNLGLRTIKFFPAGIAGGPKLLQALGEVFPGISFFATGGISPDNLAQYLSLPTVIACGGSWLAPADAIASGEFDRVIRLAMEAVMLAATIE